MNILLKKIMYERYEKWGYPCLYTTKKKMYERYEKMGVHTCYILLKLITKNGQVLVKLQCAV